MQCAAECAGFDPETISRNLHYFAYRTSVQPKDRGHARESFVPKHSYFHRFCVVHQDDEGDQSSIRKIDELDLAIRFVKTAMVRHVHKFEGRTDGLKLAIGKSKQ